MSEANDKKQEFKKLELEVKILELKNQKNKLQNELDIWEENMTPRQVRKVVPKAVSQKETPEDKEAAEKLADISNEELMKKLKGLMGK